MKREIKFRAMLSDKTYAHPRMVSWGELLDSFDALHIFDEDFMTLMQFTGLTDANGNDIYEGDLVRLDDDSEDPIYKVIFDEAKFEIFGGGVCYDLGEEFMNCEVIGNVHENPELLEE